MEVMLENKKVNVNSLLMKLLILMMLLFGLHIVPGIVSNGIKAVFVAVVFLGVISGALKLKFSPFNTLIYIYCGLLLVSLLTGGYFGFSTILSTLQFIIFTVVIVNFNKENVESGLMLYFKYIKPLVYFSIGYALVLKTFGSLMMQNGKRISYLFSPVIHQKVYGMAGQQFGYSGIYTNSNIFAFFCLVVLIILLNKQNKTNPAGKAFGCIWLMIGMWLADSRAVSVCAILVFMFAMLSKIRRKLSAKSFTALVVLLGMATVFLLFLSWRTILSYLGGVDLAGRANYWIAMFQSIKEHPVFGIGFANSSKYLLGDLSIGFTVGSHNSYLNILCENGILGFGIFVLMNLYVGLTLCKNFYKTKNIPLINIAAVIFLVFIPYAMVENAYMIVEGRSYLWLLACLCIVNWTFENKPEIRPNPVVKYC